MAALCLAGAMALAWACTGSSASAGARVDTPPEPASSSPAPGPVTDLVELRVQVSGGLGATPVPAPPVVTVYADGRLVTTAPSGSPPPALVTLQTRTLDAEGFAAVQAAADAARLAEAPYADAADPDAEVFVFTLQRGSQLITSQFTGLAPHEDDSPDIADRRARAAAFLEQLRQIPALAGDDHVSSAQPYVADRLAVSVRPVLGGGDTAVKPWPAADVDLAALSGAGGCVTLTGPAAASMRDTLTGELADTRWRERDRSWRVFASPLLPDQQGCSAVT